MSSGGTRFSSWSLCLVNDTLGPGAKPCQDDLESRDVTYDPVNHDVYTLDHDGGHVNVMSSTWAEALTYVNVGTYPVAAAVDLTTGDVYVANSGTNNISVISGFNNSVYATIPVKLHPVDEVYDAANGDLYVADENSNNVTVISTKNNSVVATLPGGPGPAHLGLDPASKSLYVSDSAYAGLTYHDLTVINLTSDTVEETLHVGDYNAVPLWPVYDPTNNNMYVPLSEANVTVINATTNGLRFNVTLPGGTGASACGVAVDTDNGQVFVSNCGTSQVNAISPTKNTVVSNISVGIGPGTSSPEELTFDASNGNIYAQTLWLNVSIISGSSDRALANVTVGDWVYGGPMPEVTGVAVDPSSGRVFASMEGSRTFLTGGGGILVLQVAEIAYINGSNLHVDADLVLGSEPSWGTYDPLNGDVYVCNYDADTVNVISSSNDNVVGSIRTQLGAFDAAVDTANGLIFVTNFFENSISVISGSNNTVIKTLPMNTPANIVYDPSNQDLYVLNYDNASITVLSASNYATLATIPVSQFPDGLAIDPTSGHLFTGSNKAYNVTVISTLTNKVVATVPIHGISYDVAADPGREILYVTEHNNYTGQNMVTFVNISTDQVLGNLTGSGPFAPFNLAFDPYNSDMYVTDSSGVVRIIDGATRAFLANISVPAGPWGITYVSPNHNPFAMGFGTATVSIMTPPNPPVYNITFVETGLATGTKWGISTNGYYNGSITPTIQFFERNGTYSYTVGSIPGYTAAPASGNVTLNGSSPSIGIRFTHVPGQYAVTFTEAGLPPLTPWSVSVGSTVLTTTTAQILLYEPNGTYTFRVANVTVPPNTVYVAFPPSVSLTVKGSPQNSSIIFSASTYAVTFTESGLPSGSLWWVNWSGGASFPSSTTNVIGLNASNGTYGYAISNPAGYIASPPSGTVTVNGTPVQVSVTFTPLSASAVTFNQTGLPAGTSWGVTLNGARANSTGVSLVFEVGNGTYNYSVNAPSGYAASPPSGLVKVVGKPVNVSVAFTRSAPPPPATYLVVFDEGGLPVNTSWSVMLNGTLHSSVTTSITFAGLTNTTTGYSFSVGKEGGYNANPPGGTVIVNGTNKTVNIAFTRAPPSPARYTVTFTETGLSTGASWTVTFNGTARSSTTSSLAFGGVTNSTAGYSFTVASVSGYTPAPSSGTVKVDGANVTYPIAFSKSPLPKTAYTVTFTESGLAKGTSWEVTLCGNTSTSTSSQILVRNATFHQCGFTVGVVTGYTVHPSSGTILLDGANVTQGISFTKNPAPTFLGLPGAEGYLLIVALVAAAATLSLVWFIRRKKREDRTGPEGGKRGSGENEASPVGAAKVR